MKADARTAALTRLRSYLGVPGDAVTLRCDARWPWQDDFAQAAPWLRVEIDGALDATLRLRGSHPHGVLAFRGEPEGRLLESLAEALRALATHTMGWDTPATPALLAELAHETRLCVYVGASCPFCPSVTAAALRMGCASERLSVAIVRAELATDLELRSVPTVTRDGAVLSVGAIGEYPLVERLLAP